MDPLLTQCRRAFTALYAIPAGGWTKNHDAVALSLWMHVQRSAPADHTLLVQTFDRDFEAKDDWVQALRRRLEAERIAERLLPVLVAAEIEHHTDQSAKLSLFAVLLDLDFRLARDVWQRVLAGRARRGEILPLFAACSREAREWALSALRECA